MLQEVGQVTPQRFQHALNETIISSLGIVLARPLCEWTARRWLLKLGWQQTRLRKGVYMDGHERDDVKKYRQEVFLPAMAAFECRMVHFEGPELLRVDPQLAPGERKVIAIFHDECCFHGNDYRTHVVSGNSHGRPCTQMLQFITWSTNLAAKRKRAHYPCFWIY